MDDIESEDSAGHLPGLTPEESAVRRLTDLITLALAQAEVLTPENTAGYLADAREIAEQVTRPAPVEDKAD